MFIFFSLGVQLTEHPQSFESLRTEISQTGSVYLGGPDWKVPDVHTSVFRQHLCGQVYLGVGIDPGSGESVIQ